MQTPTVRTLGRAAAVLALCSAGVHVALADTTSLGSLAMTAMALACLPCAWHLWRDPRPSVWGVTAAVDAAMLAVHGQMVAAMTTAGRMTQAMPGMGGTTARALWLVWLGLALVGTQLLLAAAANVPALRRREQTETAGSPDTPPVHRNGRMRAEQG